MEERLNIDTYLEILQYLELYDLLIYYRTHRVPKAVSLELFRRKFRHLSSIIPSRDTADLLRVFEGILAYIPILFEKSDKIKDPSVNQKGAEFIELIDPRERRNNFRIYFTKIREFNQLLILAYIEKEFIPWEDEETMPPLYKNPFKISLDSIIKKYSMRQSYPSSYLFFNQFKHFLGEILLWLLTLKSNNPELRIRIGPFYY